MIRPVFGDIAVGGAVFGGLELAMLAKSFGQPLVAGILGLVFALVRYKVRVAAEEKKKLAEEAAAKAKKLAEDDAAWRKTVDDALASLARELERDRNAWKLAAAHAEAPFAALEARLEASVKQYEDAHARWRREFEAMTQRAEQIMNAAEKHSAAITGIEDRVAALETDHVDLPNRPA